MDILRQPERGQRLEMLASKKVYKRERGGQKYHTVLYIAQSSASEEYSSVIINLFQCTQPPCLLSCASAFCASFWMLGYSIPAKFMDHGFNIVIYVVKYCTEDSKAAAVLSTQSTT